MKVGSFSILFIAVLFCNIGCLDQVGGEQIEVIDRQEIGEKAGSKAPYVYVHSITPQCGKLGATAKIIVGNTQYYTQVYVDIYSENGAFIDRWTRSNPDFLSQLTFNVGTPPNGTKDCSILDAGTTYRVATEAGNVPEPSAGQAWEETYNNWPNPVKEDTLNTIENCKCTS